MWYQAEFTGQYYQPYIHSYIYQGFDSAYIII